MTLLLLSLLACGGGHIPAGQCPLVAAPPVGACLSGPTPQDSGYYDGFEDAWSGVVAEVGSGPWPTGCNVAFGADPDATAWWARVDTDDGERWVGVAAPGTVPPQVGAALSVDGFFDPGEFDPTDGAVTVRDDAGALSAWVGVGGTPGELRVPTELGLARGEEVCHEEDECGSWGGYALDATVGGTTIAVSRADSAVVGGLRVTNASLYEQTSSSGCPDWFVASAEVAAVAE